MSHPAIPRIRAKLDRVEQLLAEYRAGIVAFYESEPYSLGFYDDVRDHARVVYLSKFDPFPDSVAAVASNALQDLRAVLDQIINQLALNMRGTIPDKEKIYFPIADSADRYPKLRDRMLKGMSQAVKDVIDRIGPYRDGPSHCLWQLNELSRTDRHHLLVSATGAFGGFDFNSPFRDTHPDIPMAFLSFGEEYDSVVDGSELLRELLDLPMAKQYAFKFYVSFNAPEIISPQDSTNFIHQMLFFVRAIVDAFEPFFEESE